MRVVVVSQWFRPENVPIPGDIAGGLAAAGHEVTVLTGFPSYPAGKTYPGWRQRPWLDARADRYNVRRVASYPSHDASGVRRAASFVSFCATSSAFGWRQLRGADVVYVYHPPLTSAFGPWLSRKAGGPPFVLHVQDLWPDSVLAADMIGARAAGSANRMLTSACRAVYERASSIVCIAPTMARTLHQRGISRDKLHVVANWADETTFFPAAASSGAVDLPELTGTFSVMFAGNLGHLQGLDVAVRAAAMLTDLPDFRLVLVGDGVARDSLRELAASLGAENVVFVSSRPREQMNAVTRLADVQLVSLRDLPFFRGTIPSKLAAIMASGLPVICAVNGDASTLVTDAGGGWTCPAGEVEALAKVFRDAHASSSEELADLGRAAHEYYGQHLSQSAGLARIEDILVSSMGRTGQC